MAEPPDSAPRKGGTQAPTPPWRFRYTIVVALIGIGLSVAAGFGAARWDRQLVQSELNALGDNRRLLLEDLLGDVNQALRTAAVFFHSENAEVSRQQFDTVVSNIAGVYGSAIEIDWAPRVRDRDRAAHEAAASASGAIGYRVHSLGAETVSSATEQGEYFPLFYIEGSVVQPPDYGLDIGSNPAEYDALIRGRDGGVPTTGTLQSIETGTGRTPAIAVLEPVYKSNAALGGTVIERRQNLLGFIRGRLLVGEALETNLHDVSVPQGLDMYLFDASAGPDDLPFFVHASRQRATPIAPKTKGEIVSGMHWSGDLKFGDARWTMIVVPRPGAALLSEYDRAPIVLIAGLLLTAAITAAFAVSSRYAFQLHRALDDLRRNEAKLRTFFAVASDGILVADADTGIIAEANPAAGTLVGRNSETLIGQHFSLITPPEVSKEAAEGFRRRTREGAHLEQITLLRSDGGRVPVEVSERPFDVEGRHYALGIFRDVTARIQAEQRLAYSNTLLTVMNENSPDGILVVDEHTKIVSSNHRFAEIFKIPPALVEARIDEPVLQHVASTVKDLDAFLARVRYLYEHPDVTSHDEMELQDGRIIDRHSAALYRENGEYLGRIWFFRDITERKRMEDTLQLRAFLLDSVSDSVFVHDIEGECVYVNEAAWKTRGYTRDELMAIDRSTLDTPEYAALIKDRIAELLAKGRAIFPSAHRRKDGSAIPIEINARMIDSSGRKLVVATARDVTEHLAAEKALRESEERFHTIFESVNDVIMIHEPGSMTVVDANPRVQELFGYTIDELRRSGLPLIFTDRSQAAKDKAMHLGEMAMAGEPQMFEWPAMSKSGRLIWVEVTLRRAHISGRDYLLSTSRNITVRKEATQALADSELKLQTILATMPSGLALYDTGSNNIAFGNDALAKMLGYSAEDLIGLTFKDFQPTDTVPAARRQISRLALGGKNIADELPLKRKDGSIFSASIVGMPLTIAGRPYMVVNVQDVTERKAAAEKIEQLARTDPLTGLPNRRVFVEALQQAIGRVARGGNGFAVLYLDLDHFKDVNDTLGHMAGDDLLKTVGERLRGCIRSVDVVARFGGDEFAILQTDLQRPDDAAILATKLLDQIAQPFIVSGNRVHSGTSIGISVNEPGITQGEILLSHADLALYRAKAEGRGVFRFFTESMDTQVHARVRMVGELREAIAKRQLFLEYQPQIDIATGRIIGLEALVRWHHPEHGLLPPSEFIAVAETGGLIGELGRVVIEMACRQMKEWVAAGIAPATVAVNISATQFKFPLELEKQINSILSETGLSPHFLEMELTETALMEKTPAQIEVLDRLRASGIRLAIDDFGTGYSSLDYLRSLAIDRLKVAQEFVAHIVSNANDAIIVRASISLGHALNTRVIAEGVETPEQFAIIKSLDCDEVQGFYFSRPQAAEAITALLRVGKIVPQQRQPAAPHPETALS